MGRGIKLAVLVHSGDLLLLHSPIAITSNRPRVKVSTVRFRIRVTELVKLLMDAGNPVFFGFGKLRNGWSPLFGFLGHHLSS